MENPHFSLFAPVIHTVTTLASSFPRSYSHGCYFAGVDHCDECVGIAYPCVCCVCYVCVRVCGSLLLCAGTPHFSFFCMLCLLLLSYLYHTVPNALKRSTLWEPWYNSSRTPSSSFYHGYGRCICVCACACHVSYKKPTISRGVRGCCAGDRAIQTHTCLGFQKQPRSHGGHDNSSGTATAVRQHHRFKLWHLWQPRCFRIHMRVQWSPGDIYTRTQIMITFISTYIFLYRTHVVEPLLYSYRTCAVFTRRY